MAVFRFYNGGDKIQDRVPFDNPNNDIKEDNIVSYYAVAAPEKGYFEVPQTIEFGRGRSFSNLDLTIMSKWGRLGVVRIDADADPDMSGFPSARTDREAKVKGDDIFETYLYNLVQEYVDGVEQRKTAGLQVMPAQGYTKHALKRLGIKDPALTVRNEVEKNATTAQSGEMAELRAQMAVMMSLLSDKLSPKAVAK